VEEGKEDNENKTTKKVKQRVCRRRKEVSQFLFRYGHFFVY